ncbi:unnamed protein product [Plutella xylostella]|uniref:(diamondback moth) hypothetical protein n=1 Tax=Plutella xylostella TaxID=51655 RepID=A0A8S4E435_PLUXY|nr:unnamed protein product [Plutella xylostella]
MVSRLMILAEESSMSLRGGGSARLRRHR